LRLDATIRATTAFDVAPTIEGPLWAVIGTAKPCIHQTNAQNSREKSQRLSARCQFVNRAGCLGRGEVSAPGLSFASR
jgi:hypothetical protein